MNRERDGSHHCVIGESQASPDSPVYLRATRFDAVDALRQSAFKMSRGEWMLEIDGLSRSFDSEAPPRLSPPPSVSGGVKLHS